MTAPKQEKLRIVPCSNERARNLVNALHRHHVAAGLTPVFCLAATDEDGQVHGAVIVGRPVARLLDDGWTVEVSRLVTDGLPNACSVLYGAARRVAREMGFYKILTYIREDEPGTSLRAAGWTSEGPIRARKWAMPNRHRIDKTEVVRRVRSSSVLRPGAPPTLSWPVIPSSQESLFLSVKASTHDQRRKPDSLSIRRAAPTGASGPRCTG